MNIQVQITTLTMLILIIETEILSIIMVETTVAIDTITIISVISGDSTYSQHPWESLCQKTAARTNRAAVMVQLMLCYHADKSTLAILTTTCLLIVKK